MKFFDCTRSALRSPFNDDVVYQFEYMEYVRYFSNMITFNFEIDQPVISLFCYPSLEFIKNITFFYKVLYRISIG